jgi:hypothetical protein
MDGRVLASVLDAVRQVQEGPGRPEVDEALAVVYRLLFLRLAESRGAHLEPSGTGPEDAWLRELGGGLVVEALDADRLPEALAGLHASVLQARNAEERRRGGSFFTPTELVHHLLDRALEPVLDEVGDARGVTVLDPSCGPGPFLVEAARRIARRGVPMEEAVRQVHGVDLDAGALELARACLWLELVEAGRPVRTPALHLRLDDALLGPAPDVPLDVVVGNPPFLNQLERRTSTGPDVARQLRALGDGALGPYTDMSAVFLHRAVGWVRDGGRVALVQPQSLLAARDAAGVRRHLAASCSLEHLWASDTPVFDAHVLTCAPVLRKGAGQGAVTRSHGPAFEVVEPRPEPVLTGPWSFLLAAGLGIPEVRLDGSGTVGDIASCTADFRDQYYGLAPYVREHADCPSGAPLVTTGLVEPAECRWGRASTRFLKRRWDAPVVDVPEASDDGIARWARARLVPKVLVGTQGRVLEAVADERGEWLPSVPTITVVPSSDRLWHVLAVLLAPPVTAHAAATYAGTALTMRAVKLSARQVAALPLPRDVAAWDAAAQEARAAQHDDVRRPDHLLALGRLMCTAYGVGEEVLDWWVERAGLTRGR